MKFFLDKYYFDCVNKDGSVLIVYLGSVCLFGLRFNLVQTLLSRRDAPLEVKASRAHAWRKPSGDMLEFSTKLVSCKAQGLFSKPALTERLLESPAGFLDWDCFLPRMHAEFTLQGGNSLQGLGYAERLVTNLKPWQLPIERLHWGRFVSERNSLVWIAWEYLGKKQNWLFFNGVFYPSEEGDIGPERIVLRQKGLTLELRQERAIIDEKLVAHKKRFRFLAFLIPRALRKLHETKWLSRGILYHDQHLCDEGWVVHELVRFS